MASTPSAERLARDLGRAIAEGSLVKDQIGYLEKASLVAAIATLTGQHTNEQNPLLSACLLYTSDAADDLLCVDLGGRRFIKKKKKTHNVL